MSRTVAALLALFPTALLLAQAPLTTLDGDIVNSVTGAPVAYARVKLADGNRDARYGAADVQGHFHFESLSSGVKYRLSVDHPAYIPSDPTAATAGKPIKVSLVEGAILYGSVTDPNGLPAATGGAFIAQFLTQRPPNNQLVNVGRAIVDDRGQYRSELLQPGMYYAAILSQRAPDLWEPTWRSTYFPHALDPGAATPIRLEPGQQVRADVQIVNQVGLHVTGRVTIPPYDPPPAGMEISTRVYLVQRNALIPGAGSSSAVTAGRFDAADLLPGEYTVVAETRQYTTDGAARNARSLFGTLRQIEIGQQDVPDFDLQLQPLPEVTGKVTFAEGCPASPVPVYLTTYSIMGVQRYSVVSGTDGSFGFGSFTPGPISIETAAGAASVFLGERDISKISFDYPTPEPQPVRIVVRCNTGGAQ